MSARWRRRAAAWSPTLAVVAALVVLTVTISTSVEHESRVATSADDVLAEPGSAPDRDDGGVVAGEPGSGPTTPGAPSAGGGEAADPALAGTACRADGRLPGISYAMPPCVPVFTGDNGGKTARGVGPTSVVVARWQPQSDPLTGSLVGTAGASDSPEVVARTIDGLRRYFNQHVETYGREVRFVDVTASGPTTDDSAMRADAVRIARDIGAFAVVATGEPQAFDEEAAAQGLVCIPCGLSPPTAFFQKTQGFAFGGYPPQEQYYRQMAEYIGKRLAGRPAKWAGSEAMQSQPRQFGLIWVENSPLAGGPPQPDRAAAVDFYRRQLARYGVALTADVGYQYDLTRVQEQATNAIVQMKAAGVSNVAFVGDALSPIFFTREATRQGYFPEWFITGNLATDNVILGRLYDQAQWKHAFGIGFTTVIPTTFEKSVGYLEYRTVEPSSAPASSVTTLRQPLETLFTGIQMAGPNLTAATFAKGLYAFPRSGGVPSSWLSYYTPSDPTSVKDFRELWWNGSGTGADEYGHAGTGVIMNVDGGRRYELGGWPTTEPAVFDPARASTSADDGYYAQQFALERGRPKPTGPCRSCR